MTFWDQKFLKKLKSLGIKVDVYKRYVDNIFMILPEISSGWFFNKESRRLEFDLDDPLSSASPDARTFMILEEIANSLDDDIQVESDYPSNHESGRLPVLDLEMFIQDEIVEFSFYKKKMTSPFCNMYRSAISAKTKCDSLFQEGLRRLRNMSSGIDIQERNIIMSQFMNCLKISGYNHEYCFTLLRGILQRKEQLEEDFRTGAKSRYRSRHQITSQKKSRLGKYPNTWFLKGDVGNTLKVPYTPSGKLKSLIDAKLKEKGLETADGCLTKVIELAGRNISSGLKKSQNFGGDVGCYFGS